MNDTPSAVSQLPVLVVDDEPSILRSASVLLCSSGITHVLTLADSRALLPLLAEQAVGMVVLDLTMPYLSSQKLLEQQFHRVPLSQKSSGRGSSKSGLILILPRCWPNLRFWGT